MPVYIRGANSWKSGQQVSVSFGPYFLPDELDKTQISQKIAVEIDKLQQQVNNSELTK